MLCVPSLVQHSCRCFLNVEFVSLSNTDLRGDRSYAHPARTLISHFNPNTFASQSYFHHHPSLQTFHTIPLVHATELLVGWWCPWWHSNLHCHVNFSLHWSSCVWKKWTNDSHVTAWVQVHQESRIQLHYRTGIPYNFNHSCDIYFHPQWNCATLASISASSVICILSAGVCSRLPAAVIVMYRVYLKMCLFVVCNQEEWVAVPELFQSISSRKQISGLTSNTLDKAAAIMVMLLLPYTRILTRIDNFDLGE